jgi:hypothetical protein
LHQSDAYEEANEDDYDSFNGDEYFGYSSYEDEDSEED